MKAALCLALALFAVPACATDSSAKAGVTPVQKVIELLTGMLEKGKKEKHGEQVQFAAYKQFCDDTSADKKSAIANAEETIEVLKADIQKNAADAVELAKEITELEAGIAKWSGQIKAATKDRKLEKGDYDATHKDYSESVEALQMAIAVLQKQAFDRTQASSLVQVSVLNTVRLIPDEAKKAIDTFLAQEVDAGIDVSAPEANAYEIQSHGIIEMLDKLLDKFIDERTTLEKEEMNSRQAYEMLMHDLKAQIDEAEKDASDKAETKAKKLHAKAAAEADLKDTIASMEADKKYLADLTATCHQKTANFESRQGLRAEELEAIDKAIEIMESGAVAGNAAKHLPALMQMKGASMSQLRTGVQSPAQTRVVQYLRDQAKHLDSRMLSALAIRVADNPFKKVLKMIKDLIVRLMEEANEEAEHKGWCDTELSTNEQTRKEKSMAVETLNAEVDELEASIAKLTEDIAELTKAVAELSSAMAKASGIREDEKDKNAETVKDSQAAQEAVAQALVVLKEFYAKAAQATALVQNKREPEILDDKPYKGNQDENGGVVGMLEVIESDFARLESDTKAAESSSQKEYNEFMTDSAVDKSTKEADIEHKTAKKQDQEQTLVSKKDDLDGTQKELQAAMEYFDKLKPSCVDSGVSYEARVAQRKEEIESLQEALKILSGDSA